MNVARFAGANLGLEGARQEKGHGRGARARDKRQGPETGTTERGDRQKGREDMSGNNLRTRTTVLT